MKIFALAILALLPSLASAAEIVVHVATSHGRSTNLNGVTPGLGVALDNGVVVGAYVNSYRKAAMLGQ